ncbi:CotH kinase family protein [Stigmatella hybrida]|uniref:CotH kinase family protein n=1 Tax=Stigmatella hybrida TaxID=394097 RepID=UPI001CDA5907|nr:CotH kinase family protein [Stigmatella hybrida]
MRIALLLGLPLLVMACGGPAEHGLTQDPPPIHVGPGEGDAPTPPAPKPPELQPPEPGPPGEPPPQGPGSQTPRPSPDQPRWPALQTSIPVYELTLSQADYQALHAHIHDPPSKDFSVPGQFTLQGRAYAVELSFRGRSTKTDPRVVKKSWDVRFDKQDRFEGKKKSMELLAAWKDSGYLTEKLWYDMAASLGLRVPDARYAHVKLHLKQPDGSVITRYEGVFTELESINKDFLKAHGFDSDSDLYRSGMHDGELLPPPKEHYQEPWDKKTNEEAPWTELWSFLEGLNRTPPHAFPAFVEKNLEVEDYLTWLAMEALIAHTMQGDARSYFIYDRETAKWSHVPWDLNNALSLYNRTNAVVQGVKKTRPLFSFTPYDPKVYELYAERRTFEGMEGLKLGWSTLSTRIYDDPGLRARYAARLRKLLDTWFTEENLGPRIDAMHALLAPYILPGPDGQAKDPYVSTAHAARSAEYLHRFVRERRAWLLEHLKDIEFHGANALVIDRVGRDASGAFWVQLYNRASVPVSLGGLQLSGLSRVPEQWRLPEFSLPPGQVITFRQGAVGVGEMPLGATLDPKAPELSLYSADGLTALDLLWLAPLKPGEAYGRLPRGAETFGPQQGP